MRALARAGIGERRLLLALAERAAITAPAAMRPTYERWVQAYREGRRIKIGIYPVALLEPVDPELSNAVDAAFEQGEQA
jgi:hypothetical protein